MSYIIAEVYHQTLKAWYIPKKSKAIKQFAEMFRKDVADIDINSVLFHLIDLTNFVRARCQYKRGAGVKQKDESFFSALSINKSIMIPIIIPIFC